MVNEGEFVDKAYLGVSKAFDLLCHAIPLEKLAIPGFDSCLRNWLRGFFQGCLMSVYVAENRVKKWTSHQGSYRGQYLDPWYFSFMSISLLQVLLDRGRFEVC